MLNQVFGMKPAEKIQVSKVVPMVLTSRTTGSGFHKFHSFHEKTQRTRIPPFSAGPK